MRFKIFSIDFWKAIFGLDNPSPLHSEKAQKTLLEPKKMSEYLPTLTLPLEAKFEAPEGISEKGRGQEKKNQEEKNPETIPTEVEDEKEESVEQKLAKEEKLTRTQIEKKGESLIVRSELNLEQYSIFTVSTYRKKSREITIREVGPAGEITERKAIIGKTAGGIETGALTIHHFKVYLCLLELWEKAGRPIHEPVHFTILRIIKRLGMVDAGSNYEMIKRQLFDLRQIPLTFTDSFFVPKEESFKSLEPFSILSHLKIYERKKVGEQRQKTRGYGEFRFDDHILKNLVNNYTHPLRLDVVKSFKKRKDLAILLYTYLDRNLAFKVKYAIGLEKLFEHLDLSQRQVRCPADRKAKIEPVTKELQGKPLSTGILSYCRVHKTKDERDYKLICRKKQFKRLEEKEAPPQLAPEPQSELISLLVEKGLTEKQAEKLLSEKGEQVIKAQLAYFPFRLEEYQTQGKEIKETAILYDSIRDNWQPPSSYFEAEREKEKETKLQTLKEEYQRRIKEAKTQAEEWVSQPSEERIAAQLEFWITGQKTFNHHQPTEEEIKAKKEELISNLPSKEGHLNQLINEIEGDIQAKKQKLLGSR